MGSETWFSYLCAPLGRFLFQGNFFTAMGDLAGLWAIAGGQFVDAVFIAKYKPKLIHF